MQSANTHIGAMIGALNDAGLGIRLNADAPSFREFYCRMVGYEPASPLDTTFVRLDNRSFFWLQIQDAKHRPIGCAAGRLVLAPAWRGGLRRLLLSQSLFIDRGKPLWLSGRAPDTDLSGRLGYVGGGWIHPSWRRHGLIGIAIQLVHAYMALHYRTDHNFGFVRPNHIPLGLGDDGYAFASADDAFSAYCPGTGFDEPLHLVRVSRAQLEQRYARPPAYGLRTTIDGIPEIQPEVPAVTPLLHEERAEMRKAG